MVTRLSAVAALAACAMFIGTPIDAGIIRHDVADASYLAVGNDADFNAVGQVTFTGNSDWASGVLIGEQWFVTAGHVVRSNFINNTPGNVLFTVGGNTYSGQQIIMNPGYVHGQPYNGNDIAIVQLSSVVGNVTASAVYNQTDELGQLGTFVGFGRTGTGLTGVQITPATKRGGTNDVDVTGNTADNTWSTNTLLSDFDRPSFPDDSSWGSTTPTDLEYLTAEKDSGAGLFLEDGGDYYLAGVISFAILNGDSINYGYGDSSAATRISSHIAWLEANVPDLTVLPEASSFLLLSAAGFTAGFYYWRRRS